MKTFANIRPYTHLLLHGLGWLLLGFLLLFYMPLTWQVTVPAVFWVWQSLLLLMMLGLFYANAKIVVPRTLVRHQTLAFVLWFIAAVLLMQVLAYIGNYYTGFRSQMSALLGDKIRRDRQPLDSFIFTITLIVLGISTSWAMLQNWQRSAQLQQRLEQEKVVAELAMLKVQINPHFFFNTLNNIYSLTYINIEDSRNALHTLSRMMRYLLYGSESGQTSLLKEVAFLKDYISLMRLRTSDRLQIDVCFPPKIADRPIAPMLLLPFVENAFKHGVPATGPGIIHITLRQEAQQITFEVSNQVFPKASGAIEEGGIGLANTKRRLQLMYPHRHRLSADVDQQGTYRVVLQIDLES